MPCWPRSCSSWRDSPDGGLTHFVDVPDTAWCYSAVSWAVSRDIMSGVDGETFTPQPPPHPQELAFTLFRYAKEAGLDTKVRADLTPTLTPARWRLGPGGRGMGGGPGHAGRTQHRKHPDPCPAGHRYPGRVLRRAQDAVRDRPAQAVTKSLSPISTSPRMRPRGCFLFAADPFRVKVWNICPNYSYPPDTEVPAPLSSSARPRERRRP